MGGECYIVILMIESNPGYHTRLMELFVGKGAPVVETGPFCHWSTGLWFTREEHAKEIIKQVELSFSKTTPPSLILMDLYLRDREKDYGQDGPQYILLSVEIANYIANNHSKNIPIVFMSKVKGNGTIEKLNKAFRSYNGVRPEWALIEKPPSTVELKTDHNAKYSNCAHQGTLDCNIEFNKCSIAVCFYQQVLTIGQKII